MAAESNKQPSRSLLHPLGGASLYISVRFLSPPHQSATRPSFLSPLLTAFNHQPVSLPTMTTILGLALASHRLALPLPSADPFADPVHPSTRGRKPAIYVTGGDQKRADVPTLPLLWFAQSVPPASLVLFPSFPNSSFSFKNQRRLSGSHSTFFCSTTGS